MQTKTGHLGQQRPSLSVVIPMYNEESRIKKTLDDIFFYLDSDKNTFFKRYEIILVDDGSLDDTVQTVSVFDKARLIRLDKNYGKGRAVKEGVLQSKNEYVIYMDADNAVSISEIQNLIPYLNEYDAIIGSRKSNVFAHGPGIKRNARRLISLTGTMLNKTLISGIYDSQCPFKLFRTDIAKKAFSRMRVERYAFDLELLYLIQKDNVKVREVGVAYKAQAGSKFRIVRDVYFTFLDFIKIHFNFLSGKYR